MTKEQEKKLLADVAELMKFMKNRKRQQLSFPVDATSQNIIKKICS